MKPFFFLPKIPTRHKLPILGVPRRLQNTNKFLMMNWK